MFHLTDLAKYADDLDLCRLPTDRVEFEDISREPRKTR